MNLPVLADNPKYMLATPQLARAEVEAIRSLSAYLITDAGQAATDDDLKGWLRDRGWPDSKLKRWTERIAAELALNDPHESDPQLIAHRFSHRLERIAFKAEDANDFKHAIEATEAQAKLHSIGGFKSAGAPQVTLNLTNANAHLLSDDELMKIAAAKPVNATVIVSDPVFDIEHDPLLG